MLPIRENQYKTPCNYIQSQIKRTHKWQKKGRYSAVTNKIYICDSKEIMVLETIFTIFRSNAFDCYTWKRFFRNLFYRRKGNRKIAAACVLLDSIAIKFTALCFYSLILSYICFVWYSLSLCKFQSLIYYYFD